MKQFVYFEKGKKAYPVKVFANKQPSEETKPKSGVWSLREWDGKSWIMPCFPEVTWGILKELIYFGELKADSPKTIVLT